MMAKNQELHTLYSAPGSPRRRFAAPGQRARLPRSGAMTVISDGVLPFMWGFLNIVKPLFPVPVLGSYYGGLHLEKLLRLR